MKRISIIVMLFFKLFDSCALAQAFQWGRYVNGQFVDIQDLEASNITSDFGVRNAGPNATIFHRGVDITPLGSANVILAAPFNGRIQAIHPNQGHIRTLTIGSDTDSTLRICLLHIFNNNALPVTYNGFRLQMIGNEPVIVDIVNCRAFARTAGLQVACNGQPITGTNPAIETQNNFEAGWPIAPMGISGFKQAGVAYDYHVHVTQFENNSDNYNSFTDCVDAFHDLTISGAIVPLGCRIRNRPLNPPININNGNLCENDHNGQWNNFTPSYLNNTRNAVQVEVYMDGASDVPNNPDPNRVDRYSNAFMNESLVEIELAKNDVGIFHRIRGSNFESRFRVDPRGAETIYPDGMRTGWGGTNENQAGCDPYSYTSNLMGHQPPGFHPHDYYITPDFYLRIHQDDIFGAPVTLANYPWDARYPDGAYSIRARTTDINSVISDSPMVPFEIDNFKPFIQKVEVKFEHLGATAYSNSWSPSPIAFSTVSRLQLGAAVEEGVSSLPPGPLTVYACASESMGEINARIPSLGPDTIDGELIDNSNNKWKFIFLNTSGISYGQCYKIIFNGQDLSGNELLDFQIESQNPSIPTNCNQGITKRGIIPKRSSANSWDANTVSGQDEVHRFRVLDCGGFRSAEKLAENNIDCEQLAQSIAYDVHFTSTSTSNDGSIGLTITGSNDVQVSWSDINQIEIGQGSEISSLTTGWYCFELVQQCCIISDCIEVGVCDLDVTGTIHHPTSSTLGSITTATTDGIAPFQYQWSTGATSSNLEQIPAGIYTVTVSDAPHCSVVRTFTLINCPEITVAAQVILHQPSSCNSSDGRIQVLGISVSGGAQPISFSWIDENGNLLAGALSGLPPGKYCLIATDAVGCTGSQCFDLFPEHFPNFEPEIINPECVGVENGSILVAATNPQLSQYDFYWDNGQLDEDCNTSFVEGLSAGEYCVTVSSVATSCEVVQCYEVPSVAPTAPLHVSSSQINPCKGLSNGSIEILVDGGVAPYLFDWNDLPILTVGNRINVAEGNYTLTITDYCGSQVVHAVTLSPLQAMKATITPGCAGFGWISVYPITGTGNGLTQISWQNGQNGNTIFNLNTGSHCYTLTDSEGCTASGCVQLYNSDYTVEVTEPCQGMSDGVIVVTINNPTEGAVIVEFEGGVIYSNQQAPSTVKVTIPSLVGGLEYQLDVTIAGCGQEAPSIYTLGAHPTELVFDHYNDPDEECVYKDACNGIIIPGSTTIKKPRYDLDQAFGGAFTECEVAAYCDTIFVEWEDFKKQTVKAARYAEILAQAWFYPFPEDVLIGRTNFFYSLGLADCDNVRYCPATLRISSIVHTLSPWIDATSLGEGCYALDCTPICCGDNDFCIDDQGFLPPFFDAIGDQGNIVSACQPATANLYQLMVWENELRAQFQGDFNNTQLYTQYIDFYRGNPKANCAKVLFCQSDYSVIWSNIYTVSCDDYIHINCNDTTNVWQPDCIQPVDFGTDCFGFVCADPTEDNALYGWDDCTDPNSPTYGDYVQMLGHYEFICPEFPGHFLTGGGNDEYIKIISNEYCEGVLTSLGTSIYEGRRFPKGITSCGDVSKFMDYSINSRIDISEEIPGIEYFVDDWDSSRLTYVKQILPGQYYLVESKGILEDWSLFVHGSSLASIKYFDKEGDVFLLGGEFQGALTIGGNQLANQTEKSLFYVRLSQSGTILDYNIIRGLNLEKRTSFVRGDTGIRIVGYPSNQLVYVNGTPYAVPVNVLTDIVFENGFSAQVKSTPVADLSYSIDRVAKRAVSTPSTSVTYLLKKSTGFDGDQILLFSTDANGNALWTKTIHTNLFNAEDYDIKYNEDGNLIVALSFSGSIYVDSTVFNSTGGIDVVLLCFDSIGSLNRQIQYGSVDDENVSSLFIEEGLIYFGGELLGASYPREIGKHKFVSLSQNVSAPYISFLTMADMLPNQEKPNLLAGANVNNGRGKIEVFPNPVNDELIVRLSGTMDKNCRIKIFDMIGKLILDLEVIDFAEGNEFRISNLKAFPTGVYMVEVFCTNVPIYHTKIVKE